MEKNVDPELRAWMMPDFSTSTQHDVIIASILMMGALQKYFEYKMALMCGIPSVTLLGQKSDWEVILCRVDKLETYGEEPKRFGELLQPVLRRFGKSFDEPTSPQIVEFWQQIAHHQWGGSDPYYYSGWITAFGFWDEHGRSMCNTRDHRSATATHSPSLWDRRRNLVLDGMTYHEVKSTKVPAAFTSVPVKIDDNGDMVPAIFVAGLVGIRWSNSEGNSKSGLDTISPVSGWWMFEKLGNEDERGLREIEWSNSKTPSGGKTSV